MVNATSRNASETVVVKVKGQLLDTASFESSDAAETYKRGVRRWALEKGIRVEIWSHGPETLRRAVNSSRMMLLPQVS